MKNKKYRILSLLLAIASLLNCFPFFVLSAGSDDPSSEQTSVVEEPKEVDSGYIEGFVSVSCEDSDSVILERGKKLYAFSALDETLGDAVTYKWEIKNRNGSWGIITGYVLPYAVISDALILNAITEDGSAHLRCVVTKDGVKYVSNELTVTRSEDVAQGEETLEPRVLAASPSGVVATPLAQTDDTTPDGTVSDGEDTDGSSSGDTAHDAFQLVINYTYRHATAAKQLNLDGANAANVFAVTLQAGAYYTGTIATPPEIGYLPYVKISQESFVTGYHQSSSAPAGSDDRAFPDSYYIEYDGEQYVLANSIQFDNQSTAEQINVYFIPQEVTFRVKIYEQNLYDDEYTLAETITYTRIANESVGQTGVKYDTARRGFTSLYYDPALPIAEDGSSSIDIYYDRIYYHVDFILNDNKEAFGAPNCYVRYKTPVVLPTPTRPAYAFTEWTIDSVLGDDNKTSVDTHHYPQTAQGGYQILSTEHNVYYSAGWETKTTSYTVIYWLENPDDPGFTLDSYKVVEGVKPGDEVDAPNDYSASDKAYFTFNSTLSDKNVTVAADGTTAVNAYYLRNYYTLTFKGSGVCLTPEHTHTDACPKGTCSLEPHVHSMACGLGTLICDKELHTHEDKCCSLPEHAHSDECCTITKHIHDMVNYTDCTKPEHKNHHMECYSRNALATSDSLTGTPLTAYQNLVKRVSGPVNGYIYRIRATRNGAICNFIYIHGEWFFLGQGDDYNGVSYTGRLNNPNNNATSATSAQATVICGLELHTHGDGTCTCSTPEHDHTTGCTCDEVRHVHGEGDCNYICGKESHKQHGIDCFTFNCNKVAHAHTADCVRTCQQVEHTHAGDCNTKKSREFLKICRKYDSNISSVWTQIGQNFTNGQRWKANTYFSQVLVYLPFMPPANITFSEDAGTANKIYNINYYLESLGTDDATYVDSYKKYFDLSNTIKAKYSYLTKKEDFFDIRGFTQLGSNPGFSGDQLQTNNGGDVYLYYSRNDYYLEFVSLGTTLSPFTKTLKYQQPIGASFEPSASDIPYPSNEEPGAIKFVGWYTTPNCAAGTEFTFDGNSVMPVGGLVLYAKWETCSYKVNVYPDKESQLPVTSYPQTVLFGSFILEPDHSKLRDDQLETPKPDGTITETKMVFAGWYYVDVDGVEKRFDFNTMSVKSDMNIYAKWTTRIPVKYTIRYVFYDGQDYVDVAEPIIAMSLANITKTFSAKVTTGEGGLYEEYKTGYFPEVRSHTMIMSDDESENVFYFVYTIPDEVKYTVTHVFSDSELESVLGTGNTTLTESFEHTITGEDIKNSASSVVVSFREGISKDALAAAVKEQYGKTLDNEDKNLLWKIITTLSPNYFIHDVTLTSKSEDNQFTFNWKKNGEGALYQVVRYIESVDGSEYTVYDNTPGAAAVGTTIYALEKIKVLEEINYFTLDTTHPDTISEGEVKAITSNSDGSGLEKGLVLRLYYKRNSYPYTVYHYKAGTQQTLVEPVTKTAKYQEKISIADEALDIPGYTLDNASGDPTTILPSPPNTNVVVCSYQGLEVYYLYQVRGVGASIENPTDTVVIGGGAPKSKTLELWGKNGEYFVNNWYYSVGGGEEEPVPESWLSDDKMTITIPESAVKVEHAGKMIYVYAEVVPATRRFIVDGFLSPENDPQAFVFHIRGAETATADVDVDFIIFDNGYVDISHLPYGTYTITTLHWAWRYGAPASVTFGGVEHPIENGQVTLELKVSGDVIITYPAKMNEQWLTDDASGIVPLGKEHEKQ